MNEKLKELVAQAGRAAANLAAEAAKKAVAEAVAKHSAEAIEAGKRLATAGTEAAAAALLGESGRLDMASRSLTLKDELLAGLLVKQALQWLPAAEVTIAPAPDGLLVGALVDGKRVTAVLDLTEVAFRGGQVAVTVKTPSGVTLEGRPLTDLFARLVARMFGGGWFGAKLLGLALPSQLTWDGAVAHYSVAVATEEGIPPELRTLVAVAFVTRAEGKTTFKLDQVEALGQLLPLLLRLLREYFASIAKT